MLVVLLIIGIIGGLAVLSVHVSDGARAGQAARRFRAVYAAAHDEAQMQGRNFAIGFWQRGWRFYERDEAGAWRPLIGDGLLRPRTLESGVTLGLRLDGATVDLAGADHTHPQVFLLGSGEAQPFVIELVENGRPRVELRGDALGRVSEVGVHAR